jgi:hypothetical protein
MMAKMKNSFYTTLSYNNRMFLAHLILTLGCGHLIELVMQNEVLSIFYYFHFHLSWTPCGLANVGVNSIFI